MVAFVVVVVAVVEIGVVGVVVVKGQQTLVVVVVDLQ